MSCFRLELPELRGLSFLLARLGETRHRLAGGRPLGLEWPAAPVLIADWPPHGRLRGAAMVQLCGRPKSTIIVGFQVRARLDMPPPPGRFKVTDCARPG